MEDENVVDILKWLFKDETKVDIFGVLILQSKNEEPTKWNVSFCFDFAKFPSFTGPPQR
jgi:hypothetical protein